MTLVSEILPKNLRAYGTAIVAGVGIFGTVAASLVGKYLPWRTAYLVGGGLGLLLLVTRFSLRESAMFRDLGAQEGVTRGDFLSLFLATLAGVATHLTVHGLSPALFYALAGYLGLATGYWAVFVTIAAEQFGTNLRATAATTVPNFVRGAVPLITGSFTLLLGPLGFIGSAWTVGLVCIALALGSL